LATGGAVAFLDADDFWSPEHLEAGLGLLASGAGLVATGIRIFELSTGRTLKESRPPPCLATDPLRTLFAESAIVTSSSVLLSRDVVLRTGAFDPDFRVGEDRDYWLRAALAGGRFAIAPAPTCHYAKHAGNTMSRTLLVAAQTVRFYEKYFNLAEIPRTLRRQSLAHSLLNEGRLLRRSDARASTRQLWRGWRLQPCDVDLAAHLALSGGRALFHSQVESS
jgi:GT2 family glycosyltransferase